MEKTVITYETIYEFLRNEKNKQELQKLSNTFFEDVAHYLAEKEKILKDTENKTDVFSKKESQKIRLQLQNTKNLLTDIYTRRERKIIDLAINLVRTKSRIIDTSTIHVREKALFDAVLGVLETQRSDILAQLLTPVAMKKPIEKPSGKQLEFLSEVDTFVDANLKEFGPFAKGDKAAIPPEIADILVSEGKARLA